MKKLRSILILLSLVLAFTVNGQNTKKVYFAVGFFTSAHSRIITYAFVQTFNGKITNAAVIRKDRFIYSALGYWPSEANPNRENLFEKHNVDSVFLVYNESNKVVGYYEKPFEELWKIRFKEHPFQYDEFGWSQGQYKPSQPQLEFLRKEYGINNILTDYIYGDSLFKLLQDVQTPSWVSSYRTATIDTTASTNP